MGVEAEGFKFAKERLEKVPSRSSRVRSRKLRRSSNASEGSSTVISLTKGSDKRWEIRLS